MHRSSTKAERVLAAGALALGVCGGLLLAPGTAQAARPTDPQALTLAVFGDSPYGTKPTDTAELDDTPAFIDTVNADPDVRTVVHVGDIHSGKQFCTAAYDASVARLWTRFADPLVYTPGDNEWADCHKVAEGGGSYDAATGTITWNPAATDEYAHGDPVANLDLVRATFFPEAGRTLGGGRLVVQSQARSGDPRDTAYVENVTWSRKGVRFVTVDVPGGSNNDADPWYGAPVTQRQTDEAAARTAADLRWLDAAFAQAQAEGAKGVVVIEQADMWDVDGKSVAHLSNYEPLVKSLADHTNALGAPVLLLDGDSHTYRSDNPFSASAACETEGVTSGSTVPCSDSVASSHPGYDVPGFHRVTVHGSTFPLEWLKLTVDPAAAYPFSWVRVPTGLGG